MAMASLATGFGEVGAPAPRRTLPFDYAFRHELRGEPGRLVKSTVIVSIEAAFVAVSIGYGVVPKVTPIVFGPKPAPGQLTMAVTRALIPTTAPLREQPL